VHAVQQQQLAYFWWLFVPKFHYCNPVNMTTRKRLLNCYVFSVLKYGCESWTVNKNLMKRINAFEQWCYRRMLKISWKDKVPNTVGEKEQQFFRKTVQQKLVLRGSSGRNALVIIEGKIRGKRAKSRPRIMWFDDVRQWTMLKDYTEVKRNAEDREAWRAITRQPST